MEGTRLRLSREGDNQRPTAEEEKDEDNYANHLLESFFFGLPDLSHEGRSEKEEDKEPKPVRPGSF